MTRGHKGKQNQSCEGRTHRHETVYRWCEGQLSVLSGDCGDCRRVAVPAANCRLKLVYFIVCKLNLIKVDFSVFKCKMLNEEIRNSDRFIAQCFFIN